MEPDKSLGENATLFAYASPEAATHMSTSQRRYSVTAAVSNTLYRQNSQLLGEYKANRKIHRWLKIHVGWPLTCKSGKRQGNVFDEKVRGFVLDSHATCTLP